MIIEELKKETKDVGTKPDEELFGFK